MLEVDHFHGFFLVFRWIYLHGLHAIRHMSDGHCYHAADGVLPPFILFLLHVSAFPCKSGQPLTLLRWDPFLLVILVN